MKLQLFVRWLVLGSVVLAGAARADAEAWRFAVIGDMRGAVGAINTSALSLLAQALVKDKVDLVLVTGDLVKGSPLGLHSQLREWQAVMGPAYRAGIAVLPIRGNHEAGGSEGAWKKAFSDLPTNGPSGEQGLTYNVLHKNAMFIGLDQYVRSHRVNQPWLDKVLGGNTQPHVFVFSHESAFAAEHKTTMAHRPDDRDVFWNSLGAAGARMYFCGHDHFYARGAVADAGGNSVQQLIVGSGGAPSDEFTQYRDSRVQPCFQASRQCGYVLVEVDGSKVSVQWKAELTPGVFTAADQFAYSALPRMARARPKTGPAILATGTP